MAIRSQYVIYRASYLATGLSIVGALFGLGALTCAFWSVRYLDPYWLLYAIPLAIPAIVLNILASRHNDKIIQKAQEEASQFQLQHMIPVDYKDGNLYVLCPNCLRVIDANKKCECGNDKWQKNILFNLEYEDIMKNPAPYIARSNEILKKYPNLNVKK